MKNAKKSNSEILIPKEHIENKIFLIQGKKVLLDRDLAQLYGVGTKVLNQSVKRNIERFPEDFMFKLTKNETKELVANCDRFNSLKHSSSTTYAFNKTKEPVTNCDRFNSLKHSSSTPYAFTEQGVAMLSSVLNSDRAVEVNIQIMRTFTKLREIMSTHHDLRHKIEEMEKKYDYQFKAVFEAIRQLLEPSPEKQKEPIGFR